MAPFSRDTAGIILPLKKFRSHLNGSNNLTEEKNFGEMRVFVRSETVIGNYPAKWSYPAETSMNIDSVDQEWIDNHVSQSRYLLQIFR